MKNHFLSFVVSILLSCTAFSQAPTCPNNQIYIHQGANVQFQTVPLPGPAGTAITGLPAGSGGLAVGPNLGFPAPNPTYWTTSGSTYWYYNGAGWTNTGHNTGNGAAVNIGCGGGFMYNLVGGTGQIYSYNGSGNGTLLVTLAGFSGGGPYDVVCDMAGNFFILKNTAPQSLSMYGPNGVLKCSWNLASSPISSAGGGFAIVGDKVYYHNGSFYAGTIIPGNSTITFTAQAAIASPSDFASCPIPIPTGTTIAPNGGTLSCTVPSLPLVAMIIPGGIGFPSSAVPASSLATCNYTWSGPGIIAGQFTPTITVNQPGVYSWTTCTGGCPSYSVTNSFTVIGQGAVITPTITAPSCMSGNAVLSVSPNSATNTILWSGPGIVSGQGTATININTAGLYSVNITIPNSACAGTATVNVLANPTLNIAYSSPTVCAQNINNSPNTITLTPSGATNYTLLTGPGYSASSSTLAPMVLTSAAPFSQNAVVASNTLIGSNGVCSATINSNFSILPNPVIAAAPATASVCQGGNFTFSANGAATYTWSPSTGLNATTGSSVIANPTLTTIYSVMGSSVGCNSATQTVTLTVMPIPTVNISPATPTICFGGSIGLTANSNANTFNWSPGTGLNTTTAANVIAGPSATQNYSVLVSLNSCTNSAVVQVSVIVLPNLLTNVSQPVICSGEKTNINVNGANSYVWSPATGLNTSAGSFVEASPATSTSYTITGFNGVCTASASVFIEIVPSPAIVLSSPGEQICEGKSAAITVNGASNYTWSPSTALSTTTGSFVVATPLSTTNYTVVGYNQSGTVVCTQKMSYSVIVVPMAEANVSPSVAICAGDKTTLTAGGGNTIVWTPTTGLNVGTGGGVVASPNVSTEYTVDVSHYGNCNGYNTVFVKVNPVPSVTAGRDTTINLDQPMFLSANGTGTMTWVDGEEISCRVCPNSQVFPKRNSCYTIETVNDFGCTAKDEMCIEVTKDFGIYVPNAFTPNGDGLNDEFLASGYNITDFSMDIFDRWGEKLFTSKELTTGWKGIFKGVVCEVGVYVYKISYKGLDGKKVNKTGHVTLNK
ncbi:MAG: gliding motility-associated C-terminal domain-containing protein [Bacteroidia bacterium]|nr:gliding motility-associated C-terminal domain-containing protein [Bacteroidia bacterium]